MHRWFGLFLVVTAAACSGGFPFDSSYDDDLSAEIAEGRREAEQYDQYREDLYDQYASEASTEIALFELEESFFSDDSESSSSGGQSGCPNGCIYHPPGCDVKGNISFDTDEKIYHVPGQDYYNETIIRPEYGERWFCTESEAKANGWRKAEV